MKDEKHVREEVDVVEIGEQERAILADSPCAVGLGDGRSGGGGVSSEIGCRLHLVRRHVLI